MKKTYETPKAEKLEFDYSNTVAASGARSGCSGGIYRAFTHGYSNCHERETDIWVNPYGNQ